MLTQSPFSIPPSTWNFHLSSGDERGPQHTQEGETGASVQAQGEHATFPGRGGGPSAVPAEGLLRQELPRLQAQSHDQEARFGTGTDQRGVEDIQVSKTRVQVVNL